MPSGELMGQAGRAHAPPWVDRAAFLAVALAFTLLTQYVYVDVIVGASIFDYMGLRALPVPDAVRWSFIALAILPAMWLPTHLRQPSDLAQLFLYFAVYLQTAALMPLVSSAPRDEQFTFCVVALVALLALDLRYLLPQLRLQAPAIDSRIFWMGLACWYVLAFVAFYRSGYLSLSGAGFGDVYELRAEIAGRVRELGVVFVYTSLWSGTVFAPALIIAGLHRKSMLLSIAGVALAWASFVVSTNRSHYMAIIPVVGGYLLLRRTNGRHLAAFMGAAFIGLTGVLLAGDAVLDRLAGVDAPPLLTFQVFFRTFANNGFLSAIYLDVFRDMHFAYYADSFLRAFPGPRLPAPVPLIAGASFTDVQGNWANANLWADGFANLGYLGMMVSALVTMVVFWIYDGIAASKPRVVATALLIVPASILANTATQTAMTSNGLIALLMLLAFWPTRESRVAVPRVAYAG